MAADSLTAFGPEVPALMWINSPSNPTGKVLPVEHLRRSSTGAGSAARSWSRTSATSSARGRPNRSRCCTRTCRGGSHEGILAVHSLSKRSNLAGYRCAFVAGDPALVGELLAVRKNLGLQMPGPAAGRDDRGPRRRRARRRAARAVRRPPGQAARGARGARASGSTTPRRRSTCGPAPADGAEDCWETVSWLADRGILVAPGAFYGRPAHQHVRVAFTATDERVDAALARL